MELFKAQKLCTVEKLKVFCVFNWNKTIHKKRDKKKKGQDLIHVFYYPVSKAGDLCWSHINLVAAPCLIAKSLQPEKLPDCSRSFSLVVTRQDDACGWGHNWHSCESWSQTGAKPLKSWWLANGMQRIITNRCVLFSSLSNFPFALRRFAHFDTFGLAGGSAVAEVTVALWWNPPHAVRLPRCKLSHWPFGQTHW